MRISLALAALAAVAVSSFIPGNEQEVFDAEEARYLIELAPGETRWIVEEEKWVLRRVRQAMRQAGDILRHYRKEPTSWTSPIPRTLGRN